jgi:6,7-dimethyl-8-ribityllumazine synthase
VSERERWPEAAELEEPAAAADEDEELVADSNNVSADPLVAEVEEEHVADSTNVSTEHAEGEFRVPDGYGVLEGNPQGGRRAVGIVVSRFNGAVTSKLLEGALAELGEAGVAQDAITIMPVPGAFELPLAAMALAKTRRYACIVALGCVIKGETPHFDFVAGEAASGLQLAALETGVPVAFGVLTLTDADQADDRLEKGAEAVRTGLEMADVFAQLRAAASR